MTVHVSPNGLVCLLELSRFYAALYCSIARLEGAVEVGLGDASDEALQKIVDGLCKDVLPGIRSDCGYAGFGVVVRQIDKVLSKHALGVLPRALMVDIREVSSRIVQSLDSAHFLRLPERQAQYFVEPLHGWDSVIEQFPEATTSIEEASKCLALGRDTACVFHLMGVLQIALNHTAKSLRVKIDVRTATWNRILTDIESAIEAKRSTIKRKSAWKARHEPFYAEVISDMRAVKNAWRNPTLHFWRTYTDEEATKIYDRTRELASTVARHSARKRKNAKTIGI